MKIDLTAALPTWENKNIVWLQLESLCRQKTELTWELIVCEEQTENMFGKENLDSYLERLKEAGCSEIKYIPLQEHTPLSRKWVIIAKEARGESFALCATDDYSSPDRFELSHKKILDGHDWFDIEKGLFLNLNRFTTSTYVDQTGVEGLTMSTRTDIVKNLNGPWPVSSVDKWLKEAGKISNLYQHQGNVLGLDTDGANAICLKRWTQYPDKEERVRYMPPFQAPEQEIEDILPTDIIMRLKAGFLEKQFLNNPTH
jgi:hypothetical protein